MWEKKIGSKHGKGTTIGIKCEKCVKISNKRNKNIKTGCKVWDRHKKKIGSKH